MSANVETMFYNRETPWHGLGTRVEGTLTSRDALEVAGLNWKVKQRPVYVYSESEGIYKSVSGVVENYRDTDESNLGIVTSSYRICQNTDAFAFTDALAGSGEIQYETAGSLNGGKRIWLLAKLEGDRKILGDDMENYLVFTNAHDGTGSIRCAVTPIRVVCQNTLNVALNTAQRSWSTKHVGDIQGKLSEAEQVLFQAHTYLDELEEFADQLANEKLEDSDLERMLHALFPITAGDREKRAANMERMRNEFMYMYFMPDIEQFRGTKWGALNAMSDFVGHTEPSRKAKTYKENRWGNIMRGHQLMDSMVKMLTVKK